MILCVDQQFLAVAVSVALRYMHMMIIMVIIFCLLGRILVEDRFRPAPPGPPWTAGEDDSSHNCLQKGRWKEVSMFFCAASFCLRVGSCSCSDVYLRCGVAEWPTQLKLCCAIVTVSSASHSSYSSYLFISFGHMKNLTVFRKKSCLKSINVFSGEIINKWE